MRPKKIRRCLENVRESSSSCLDLFGGLKVRGFQMGLPCHEVKTSRSVSLSATGSLLKLRCSCAGLAISWVQMVEDGCKRMQTAS